MDVALERRNKSAELVLALASNAPADVEVELDYNDFRYLYAGDWGSRLRVLAYPACYLTTPEVSGCSQGVAVPAVNDLATETLRFAAAPIAITPGAQPELESEAEAESDPAEDSAAPGPRGRPAPFAPPVEPEPTLEPEPTVSEPVGEPDPAESDVEEPIEAVPSEPGFAGLDSGSVYVMSASTSGESGDYAAVPTQPAGSWQVGEGSGEFSYSYPFELPAPAVGGTTPGLGLSYSSAAVDGMTKAENGQSSMAGMGWDMSPGYITRQYASCADDGLPTKGDLCWKTKSGVLVEELTLVLNGHSSKLIRVGSSENFRLQDDPGWQVTRHSGTGGISTVPDNSDNNNEAFQVRSPDGSEYWLGWGHGAGSTLTVPVFGNNADEPCKASTTATSWCHQGWRWSVDRVLDPNGNLTSYTYEQETNYYGRFGDSSQETAYDSNGYLSSIKYGASRVTGKDAHSLVTVTSRPRCTKALTSTTDTCTGSDSPTSAPELWPDVPGDLICGASGGCSNYSPSFFSTRRYDKVITKRVSGVSYLADSWQLEFTLPQAGGSDGGGVQDLWLESIRRTGQSATTPVVLPEVNFNGVWLKNRVVTPSGGHSFYKLRIDSVLAETGGRTDVVYGHATGRTCDAAYVSGRAEFASARECFRRRHGGEWEWWHKYVVTRVALGDEALGYRLGNPAATGPYLGRLRVFDYDYTGTPGWRYDTSPSRPAEDETWDDWRGYEAVTIATRRVGANQLPDAGDINKSSRKVVRFRGLHNTRANNDPSQLRTETVTTVIGGTEDDLGFLNGRVAESTVMDADGSSISRSYTDYGALESADNPFGLNAYVVFARKTINAPRTGGDKQTIVNTVHEGGDSHRGVNVGALLTSVEDHGTPTAGSDDVATCTTWVSDGTEFIRAPWLTETRKSSCSGTVLASSQIAYDGGVFGDAPTHGLPTLTAQTVEEGKEIRTEMTYDSYGRIKTASMPYSSTSTATVVNTTTYTTDTPGMVTEVKQSTPTITGNPAAFVTTSKLTAHRGLVKEATDANGQITKVTYDAIGRPVTVTEPGNTSGTPNIEFEYLVRQSNPSRVATHALRNLSGTTPTVDHSSVFYDGWGRQIESHIRNQNATGAIGSATGYDETGAAWLSMPAFWVSGGDAIPGTIVNPDPAEVTHYSETSFDGAGRPTVARDKSLGATKVQSLYTYTLTTDQVSQAGPAGTVFATTKTELDALMRPSVVHQYGNGTGPDTTTEKSFDDGYAAYNYTPLGQLAKIEKPISAAGGLITYEYTYDRLGRRTKATDPDTGTTTYEYDAAGNPTKVDDAAPNDTTGWVQTEYDVLGRPVLREQVKSDSSRTTLAEWTYDTATLGLGRVASTTSVTPLGEFTNSVAAYDKRGNPLDTTMSYPGELTGENPTGIASKTYNYTYNEAGLPTTVAHPAAPGLPAETITTTYGSYGAFKKTMSSGGQTIGSAVHDNLDRPTSLDSETAGLEAFGLRRSYAWNNLDQLTSLAGATGSASGGTAVTQLSLGYEYDVLGNPVRIVGARKDTAASTPTTAAWCYSFDGISRLKSATTGLKAATGTGCESATLEQVALVTGELYDLDYAYAQGRLASVTSGDQTVSYAYGNSSHPHAATALALTGGTAPDPGLPTSGTLEYDAGGRATAWIPADTSAGATNYAYDAQGSLKSSDQADVAGGEAGIDAEHAYDVDGIRVARVSEGVTVYVGSTEITLPEGATAAITRRNFSTPGGTPLAIETSDGADAGTTPDWTWLFADAQNTVRLSKPDDQLASQQHAFYPYGDPIGDPAGLPGEKGYLDKTHDPNREVRLDHRAYSAGLNILTTPDPLLAPANPQSINPYAYAFNNPIAMADPSGLTPATHCPGGGNALARVSGSTPYYCVNSSGVGASPVYQNPNAGQPTEEEEAAAWNYTYDEALGDDADIYHGWEEEYEGNPHMLNYSRELFLLEMEMRANMNGDACVDLWWCSWITNPTVQELIVSSAGISAITRSLVMANRARLAAEAALAADAAPAVVAGARVLSYSPKIEGQLATRGWTKEAIQSTVDNPAATHAVWDLTSGGKQAATAYVQRGGGYVVVTEESGAIVQVSNLNKVGWKPVWEDPRFVR